jgi:hypothetical protein
MHRRLGQKAADLLGTGSISGSISGWALNISEAKYNVNVGAFWLSGRFASTLQAEIN